MLAIVEFVRPGKSIAKKSATSESLAMEVDVKNEPSSAFHPTMTLIFLENWPVLTRLEGAAGMKSLSMTGKLAGLSVYNVSNSEEYLLCIEAKWWTHSNSNTQGQFQQRLHRQVSKTCQSLLGS